MTSATTAPIALPRAARPTPWIVTWLTWPVLFALTLGAIGHALAFQWSYGAVLAAINVGAITVLVALEFYPLDRRWRMTWGTFIGRDIKFFAVNGVSIAATNALFGALAIQIGGWHYGPIAGWPLWLAVPAALLGREFVQYWQHRWSHEANTPVKRWLWKTHVAHHLPEQVYVLMHPAGHPIGAFIGVGLATTVPFFVLGASPETVFVATAIASLQQVISHANVDLRAGWLNYLLVGPELHRFHHSADMREAQNFGVVTPLWDLVFGTFVYRPGTLPRALGVGEPAAYPRSNRLWQILLLPFRR